VVTVYTEQAGFTEQAGRSTVGVDITYAATRARDEGPAWAKAWPGPTICLPPIDRPGSDSTCRSAHVAAAFLSDNNGGTP
jgi:hypothetical protein